MHTEYRIIRLNDEGMEIGIDTRYTPREALHCARCEICEDSVAAVAVQRWRLLGEEGGEEVWDSETVAAVGSPVAVENWGG
jgi:hypothetical protein